MNKKGHVLKKLGWFKAKSHLTKANFKFFKCKSAKLKKGIKHVNKALAIDILFHWKKLFWIGRPVGFTTFCPFIISVWKVSCIKSNEKLALMEYAIIIA